MLFRVEPKDLIIPGKIHTTSPTQSITLYYFFLFLMDYLGISHIMHPDYTHFLDLPCLSSLPSRSSSSPTSPPKEKRIKERKKKLILCYLYTHWSMVKFLVACPLREHESFSPCIHTRSQKPEAINWGEPWLDQREVGPALPWGAGPALPWGMGLVLSWGVGLALLCSHQSLHHLLWACKGQGTFYNSFSKCFICSALHFKTPASRLILTLL